MKIKNKKGVGANQLDEKKKGKIIDIIKFKKLFFWTFIFNYFLISCHILQHLLNIF
jgi:hypothetical protein